MKSELLKQNPFLSPELSRIIFNLRNSTVMNKSGSSYSAFLKRNRWSWQSTAQKTRGVPVHPKELWTFRERGWLVETTKNEYASEVLIIACHFPSAAVLGMENLTVFFIKGSKKFSLALSFFDVLTFAMLGSVFY